MKIKFLTVLILTTAALFAKPDVKTAPDSKVEANIQLRDIDLEAIFKTTHGRDARLGFDIKEHEKKQFEIEDSGHTYGEMTIDGIKRFLIYTIAKFNLEPSKVRLLDIGSGTGRVSMGCCALADFKKCDGVELSSARFKIAKNSLNKFLKKYSHILKEDQVTFTNMNALKYNMREYNLIWFSSLCTPETLMEKLRQKLEQEAETGLIILTSQAFTLPENSRLELVETITIPMTWKKQGSTTRVYRVKDTAEALESKTSTAAAIT